MSDNQLDEDSDLGLPGLGEDEDDDDGRPVDEGEPLPALVEDDQDPLDDSYADDVPIDVDISTDTAEPTVVGDDAEGPEGAATEHEGVDIEEGGTSLIDEGRGHAEEGLEFGGDDELGLDPIPTETDDGGLEGLDEPDARGADSLPPLDGADDDDDDDDEVDIGFEIGAPAPDPALEDDDGED